MSESVKGLGSLPQTGFDLPDADKGYKCSCCGQYVKRYFRKFNSNMALALIILYRNKDKGFIHLENTMKELGYKRCGDASYLRHYRLIEKKEGNRDDGSPRNGMYKITGIGIMFVEGKSKVQGTFIISNNKHEGFEGDKITIQDALGKKFDYTELMKADYTIQKQ
jgi:hypothetical protein